MTNEPKTKVFSEAKGKYSIMEDNKVFSFEFPLGSTLELNYAIISKFRTVIWEAMEAQRAKEGEKEKDSKEICDCDKEDVKA